MNNNPSPGNKAGGLTTILEKSLGAAAKGGTTPLTRVYEYAEPVTREGLRVHGHARLRPGRRRPARSPAAPTCSASPPAAARPLAASRRPRSSSPPTTTIYRAHDRGHGHQLRRHPRRRVDRARRARRSSTRCSRSPRASARSRRSSAMATTNSCPGRSARLYASRTAGRTVAAAVRRNSKLNVLAISGRSKRPETRSVSGM